MATYTFVQNTSFNFPNIIVYNRLRDGVQSGYRVNTVDGYVMYNPNATDTEYDEETGQEVPVTYYYTVKYLTQNYNFDNFPWVAVPRDSVDENYIFGGGDEPEHEIM